MVIAVEPEDAGNRGVARGDDRGEFARRQSLAGVGRFEPRQSGEQPPRGGQERRADDEITLRIHARERRQPETSLVPVAPRETGAAVAPATSLRGVWRRRLQPLPRPQVFIIT